MVKEFFKPTKGKILLVILLGIVSALIFLIGYAGPRGDAPTTMYFVAMAIFALPCAVILSMIWAVDPTACARMCKTLLDPGMCDCYPDATFTIDSKLALLFLIVMGILYWYLLACLIDWLLSLRRKHPPQTPARQSPDGSSRMAGGPP